MRVDSDLAEDVQQTLGDLLSVGGQHHADVRRGEGREQLESGFQKGLGVNDGVAQSGSEERSGEDRIH